MGLGLGKIFCLLVHARMAMITRTGLGLSQESVSSSESLSVGSRDPNTCAIFCCLLSTLAES